MLTYQMICSASIYVEHIFKSLCFDKTAKKQSLWMLFEEEIFVCVANPRNFRDFVKKRMSLYAGFFFHRHLSTTITTIPIGRAQVIKYNGKGPIDEKH